jgi:isoleucyl-tRNA synthetase
MIEGRPDWCISRQRSWGVPIAFFRIKSTKEVIFDADVLEHIANLFDVHGADAWYSMSNAELLPEGSKYNPDDLVFVATFFSDQPNLTVQNTYHSRIYCG